MKSIQHLLRSNIHSFINGQNHALRGETAKDAILLDANENPYGGQYNRLPDPSHAALRKAVGGIYNVNKGKIALGNGEDEVIDVLYRMFCECKKDNVLIVKPARHAFERYAQLNEIDVTTYYADVNSPLDADEIGRLCRENTKLIWLCSPVYPTGHDYNRQEIESLLDKFEGLVVVDESYKEFSRKPSLLPCLANHDNLLLIKSLSYAWGKAGLRVAMLFGNEAIIDVYNKVRHPYNLSQAAIDGALETLTEPYQMEKTVRNIVLERNKLMEAFAFLPFCERVYPSDSNFFLARLKGVEASAIHQYLVGQHIYVADCTGIEGCENCLCISVGTKSENSALLAALRRVACKT